MKLFLAFILALVQTTPAWAAQRIISADVIEGQTTIKNYLGAKGHFEKNAAGWSGYDDAAATPVDGTGGTVTTTCTRTTTTPLSGDGSFLYTPAALGEGCSASFTIDSADKGKVLTLSLDYAVVSGTYTDDDTQIWIYNVTDAVMIQPAPFKLKNHSLSAEKFAVEFQTSTSSTSYRVLIHQATAGTAVLKIDNMQLGPQAKLYGSAVTDWVSYTPTVTNLTLGNGTQAAMWKKEGDTIKIKYSLRVGSTTSFTASAPAIPFPSGLSIDTAKYLANDFGGPSSGWAIDVSTGTRYVLVTRLNGSSFSIQSDGVNSEVVNTVPFNWATGDYLDVSFEAPISGWSSSQIMSSDASTRVVAAKFSTSTARTINNTTPTIVYETVIKDSHGAYNSSTGEYTVKVPGTYKVSGYFRTAGHSVGAAGYVMLLSVYKNGSVGSAIAGVRAAVTTSMQYEAGGATQLDCVAGDVLTFKFYADTSSTLAASNPEANYIALEMLQGPAQIAASETVSFMAYSTAGQVVGTSLVDVVFGTEVHDSHGSYDATTGIFTAPISGTYSFSWATITAAVSLSTTQRYATVLWHSAISDTIWFGDRPAGNGASMLVSSGGSASSIKMLAGQSVKVRAVSDVSTTLSATAYSVTFSGVRVGNY